MHLNFERKLGRKLKIGMLFPGQGSQFLGMGKDFYDEERIVQEMFEDASNALKENFVKLCFSSSEKILAGTIITQTGIFLVSSAIYAVLANNYGIIPDLVAGHSLGEYSAVFAAGGLNFFDSLYLLNKRASFMEKAMEGQNGGLLAVMNVPVDLLESICMRYDIPNSLENVAEIAIFNSPTQVVISGTLPDLKMISEEISTVRGKFVLLPVAGAFHSRMLKAAEKDFSAYLAKVDFHKLNFPLVNNVLAQKVQTPAELKMSLVTQTSSHIFWWNSMQHFKDMDLIIEVGPNDKLRKLLAREWPDKPILSINSLQDVSLLLDTIEELEEELG